MTNTRNTGAIISYSQVWQQWFSVCIFPLGLLIGLIGNRQQSITGNIVNVIAHFKNRQSQ